jgi:DNA-binding NtrC family response regulator
MEPSLLSVKQRFGIIGSSPLLDRALSTAVRVSNTDLTVLISGESGVGKEIFSKIIHSLSPRKHNSFIAINCGAIPEGTINSELFGHEKGAFTGATNERKGYFETYDGGTIFLDEIGEMPLDTQAYLLRVLESGEFIRVGSSKTLKTDVRIIAATNVNLEENIKKNKFRDDLYYRLNTVPIRVPSLKERKEDIYFLFRKFTVDFAERYKIEPIQIDSKGRELLEGYSWPGNIRELKNFAEQASILSERRALNSEDLIALFPNLIKRNLPVSSVIEHTGEFTGGFQEREILYKLLFDMKKDLNDLKSLLFEVIQSNDLEVTNPSSLNVFSNQDFDFKSKEIDDEPTKPILLDKDFDAMEFIEESLSIEDNEKNLIKKALKKNENRRKDAADELGISERTLYRKIKQYDL